MKRTSTLLLSGFALLALAPHVRAQSTPANQLRAAAAGTATRINAAAFLDVAGCGIDLSTVSGIADRRTGQAAMIDARLRIGSVGKLYTAAAIHQLAARGIVILDQPVSRVLLADDALSVAGRDATLRQLLNHTAGVPDYYDLPDIRRWDWRQPLTPARILTAISGRPATSVPGVRYAYSNSGYHLAALATERSVGRSLNTLITEEVIAPLNLRSTTYHETAPGGTLHGYAGRTDQWESAENTGPDSGITTTLADLRQFMRALFLEAGPLRAAGAAMTADAVETGRPRQRAGAGAEVRESRDGLSLVGHTGDVEGYLSFAYAAPMHDLTMIGHITASDPAALTELLRTTSAIVQNACSATSSSPR